MNTLRIIFQSWMLSAGLIASVITLTDSATVWAQNNHSHGMYYPMHQYMPTGEAGEWMGAVGRSVPGYFQPIKITLPGSGDVTFFSGQMPEPASVVSPAVIGVAIGFPYRIQISNLPDYPGVKLYPTVELLDRIHPPAGEESRFPIPIQLTEEDLDQVLSGRLVTKVVYLEQPQMAIPQETEGETLQLDLPPSKNLVAEADLLGRPLAIVRLGGRVPDPTQDIATYLWSPAPISWEGSEPEMIGVSRVSPATTLYDTATANLTSPRPTSSQSTITRAQNVSPSHRPFSSAKTERQSSRLFPEGTRFFFSSSMLLK